MTHKELVDLVLVKINEYSPLIQDNSNFEADPSNNVRMMPIVDSIKLLLPESIMEVIMLLPLHMFTQDTVYVSGAVASIDSKGVGRVEVPKNFVRLHEIYFDVWERSVSSVIDMSSDEYKVQQNIYVRGGVARPVVALVNNNSVASGKVLECYSFPNGTPNKENVSRFSYIVISSDADGATMKSRCVCDYVANVCAMKTLEAYGSISGIKTLQEEMAAMLQLDMR